MVSLRNSQQPLEGPPRMGRDSKRELSTQTRGFLHWLQDFRFGLMGPTTLSEISATSWLLKALTEHLNLEHCTFVSLRVSL